MPGTRKPIERRNREGFILVAVLWILAALATLAAIFSVYVINSATAFTVHDERLQAEGCMRGAIELAFYQLVANPQTASVAANPQAPPTAANPQTAPTRGRFLFRIGNAQ